MNCDKCGIELKEGDMFCNKCGNRVKPVNSKYPDYAGVYNRIMTAIYGIAILTCFTCNLAIEKTLSWFYIVLSAVALAYCITNVPVMAKRHKPIAAGACASVMVYVLLVACNWFSNGDWLFSVAYPIATVSLLFAWAILLICVSKRMDWLLKSAFISLIGGIAIITINPLCYYLLGGVVYFSDYLSLTYWPAELIGNKVAFICCVCYSLFTLVSCSGFKRSKRV